jgi:hypothetical protein
MDFLAEQNRTQQPSPGGLSHSYELAQNLQWASIPASVAKLVSIRDNSPKLFMTRGGDGVLRYPGELGLIPRLEAETVDGRTDERKHSARNAEKKFHCGGFLRLWNFKIQLSQSDCELWILEKRTRILLFFISSVFHPYRNSVLHLTRSVR